MSGHFDGFVPVHCILYTIFHPTEGTKVRHQFPPGCLEASDITFDTIKNYVIPKPQLCNKLLTFKYGSFRLVCYPVNVIAPYYARNSFSFDFVFVFPYDCATSPYESAIARLGKMFTVLEEQSQILSKAENSHVYFQLKTRDSHKHTNQEPVNDNELQGTLKNNEASQSESHGYAFEKYHEILKDLNGPNKRISVEDLITKIYRDLNNYSECLIPIDSGNAVDIKLFPLLSPPSSCLSFEDVPMPTVNLAKLIDVNWDPTMLKIVPYINGTNSIAKVAKLSDSDCNLVVECIRHLLYYNCVILADIFQFQNIYAPTSELSRFLTNPALATECQIYVTLDESTHISDLPFERKPSRTTYNNIPVRNSSSTLDVQRKGREMSIKESSFTAGIDQSGRNQYTPQSHTSSIQCHNVSDASLGNSEGGFNNKVFFTSKSCLFDMYRSLSQGQTVKEWYKTHFEKIRAARIDVRRFITFGVIHGLLYRCYSFPIMKNVGYLEVVKALGLSDGDNSTEGKWLSANSEPTNNVLSAAEIRIGLESSSSKLRERRFNHFSNADTAEDILNDVYRKLALNENKVEQSSQSGNPMMRMFGNCSDDSSGETSVKDVVSTAGSDTRNTVAFDVRRLVNSATAEDRKKGEVMRLEEDKRKDELLLLKSVRDVENFDKICTRLGRDREEVEKMLEDLGPYNVVHC